MEDAVSKYDWFEDPDARIGSEDIDDIEHGFQLYLNSARHRAGYRLSRMAMRVMIDMSKGNYLIPTCRL